MSKKANPAVIGAFVLGALVLLVGVILIFGGGKVFQRVDKFALIFPTSVKGLRVGAPVTFRGTQIGEVTDIRMILDAESDDIHIKVIIELPEEEEFDVIGEGPLADMKGAEGVLHLVRERGLRAKLTLQSLVTGQLLIDLDFYPGTPIEVVDLPSRYPQIPTIATGLQQFMQTLQEMPIRQTMLKIQKAVDAVTNFANSPKLPEMLDDIGAAASEARKLAENLNRRTDQLSEDLLATSGATRAAMVQAEKTLALEEGKPGEIADGLLRAENSVRRAADAIGSAAKEAQNVLKSVDSIVDENAPIRAEVENMVLELSAAARSVRNLADYLERHPEAFIKGKQ